MTCLTVASGYEQPEGLKCFWQCVSSAMAFVGPVQNPHGYRPVGVFCDVCNMSVLVWDCYNCGGMYCGRCIFRHRIVGGITVDDVDAGRVSANEVAEGMHAIYFRFFQRLGSEMASDPADANDMYSRPYLCH